MLSDRTDLKGDEADAYEKYIGLARRIIIHEYLFDKHEMQMLRWETYNRIKDVMALLAARFPFTMPFASELISSKGHHLELCALELFGFEWTVVRNTLDLIGSHQDEEDHEEREAAQASRFFRLDAEEYDD